MLDQEDAMTHLWRTMYGYDQDNDGNEIPNSCVLSRWEETS